MEPTKLMRKGLVSDIQGLEVVFVFVISSLKCHEEAYGMLNHGCVCDTGKERVILDDARLID